MKKPEGTNNGASNKQKGGCLKINDFSVRNIKMFSNGGVLFTLIVNGITIYGCRVVETEKGDFIGLPQRKGSDDKYYSIVYFRFDDADQRAILAEVERKLNGGE